jgi:hypothetical protein
MSKLQEKPSTLKKEHPAIQNLKFHNFFSIFVGNFCPPGSGPGFRIRIPNPDPDQLTPIDPDPILIRIQNTDMYPCTGKANITIYAPMIYMTPCVLFLMRADTLRGPVGGGLGPGNGEFFQPCEMASSR